MKQEISLSDAVGRVLEGWEFSYTTPQAILTFTDGTFTTLDICKEYERQDDTIGAGTLELLDFGDTQLVKCGIITQDELAAIRQKRDASDAKAQARAEREQYERLRCKFES